MRAEAVPIPLRRAGHTPSRLPVYVAQVPAAGIPLEGFFPIGVALSFFIRKCSLQIRHNDPLAKHHGGRRLADTGASCHSPLAQALRAICARRGGWHPFLMSVVMCNVG